MATATARRLRYRQIAETLARHGFGFFTGALGLDRRLGLAWEVLNPARPNGNYTPPVHVRLALEELGTTFIKLGQVLSTRSDLLTPDFQAELAKLQDSAPPVPFEQIRDAVCSELGRPLDELFRSFDETPLAAASIGQAHAAILPDGTDVVVKVRRPGVVEQVETDLEILQDFASLAARHWEVANDYDLVGLAQEFAQTLRSELDYLAEGRNAERFAASFADDPNVRVPRIFWDHTTSRVLTLERIRGIKINDIKALEQAGIDRPQLADRAARILLRMVFEEGFFHADPHPGNFFVESGARIGLIDFGMVGTLDERLQEHLADILLAVTSGDQEALVQAFTSVGIARRRVDRNLLAQDLQHLLARYYGRPLGEMSLGPLLQDAVEIIRRHHLRLPPNLALLVKTLLMAEGLGGQLDADFALPRVLAPYAEKLIARQYSPVRLIRKFAEAGVDSTRLGIELPRHVRRMLAEIESGDLEVGVRPTGFEPIVGRLEQLANRIVVGIIAAAFVNGLAVLLAVYHPPAIESSVGALVTIGFIAAGLLSAYLAWSIIRSRLS